MVLTAMSTEDRFEIGYALVQKKQRSFVQPSLVEHARSRGIDLVCIDLSKPLVDQGPFDAILHKLSSKEWHAELQEYEKKHPGVIIIDSPDAIERLHNRVSMLQAVSDLQLTDGKETFGIPKQSVVDRDESLSDLKVMSGLKFPVIAKPLVADGSAKSHAMSLVYNQEGLAMLTPPLVLQEFVNHGGVIFKVYVVGDYVKCVKRRSLPDVPEDELNRSEAPMPFSHISNVASTQQPCGASDYIQVELPPPKLITELARGLRKNLGLHLFNFDLIRDSKAGNHYHVIDINYFPGYAKMPAYESVLTDFFLGLANSKASANSPVAN